MRRLLLLPLFVFALAAASPATAAENHAVAITKTGFTPATLTIPNGDSVTWKNTDTTNHQIIGENNSFNSRVLAPGQSFTHVFPEKGTFAYHDGVAPTEKGTVNVQQTRVVTLQPAQAEKVMFTRSIMLKGTVSRRNSNGEEVLIQAKPYGSTDFETVARTTTSSSAWQVLVKPSRNTVYRAVWNNVPSDGKNIFVTPLLTLKRAGGGRVSVAARADVSLRGHRVLLQRLNRSRHVWRTVSSIRLKRVRANSTSFISSAAVRLGVAHGTIVRAFMTRRQAAPAMYGPAWSRSLRA